MREIKFRGWNTKKGMTREYTLNEMLVEKLENNGLDRLWLQYTGLKDKNEVEIYEGDILEYSNWNEITNKQFTNIEVNDITNIPKIDFEYCRVVGNIYENPELLTNTE